MNIDELLGQPLPPVADNEFSARVLGAICAEEQKRWTITLLAVFALLAVCALVLPLPALSLELGRIVLAIGKQAAVSLAFGVCVLTFLVERQFVRN